MKHRIGSKVLAVTMALWLTAFSCTSWISTVTGLIDTFLPAAANIYLLVSSIQDGTITPAETTAVQGFVATVTNATSLLRDLASQYNKATATAKHSIAARIEAEIGIVNTNLAQILRAVQSITRATQARIQLAVGLLLAVVTDIAAAIPGITPPPAPVNGMATARLARATVGATKMRNAGDFKKAWNTLMKLPTGNVSLDNACAAAVLK